VLFHSIRYGRKTAHSTSTLAARRSLKNAVNTFLFPTYFGRRSIKTESTFYSGNVLRALFQQNIPLPKTDLPIWKIVRTETLNRSIYSYKSTRFGLFHKYLVTIRLRVYTCHFTKKIFPAEIWGGIQIKLPK